MSATAGPLVDFLGLMLSPTLAPAMGDIPVRGPSGGWTTIPLQGATSADVLGIDPTTGMPTWASGQVRPSGGDDTLAVNQATAAGKVLAPGTFNISGPVNGLVRGSGADKTTLKCLTASAGVAFGPALGQGPLNVPGGFGGFTVDGNSISSVPLLSINTVGQIISDVTLINGTVNNPHLAVWGQNCTFIGVNAGSIVLDNGCGGNTFNKPEIHGLGGTNNTDLIIIQQSVPPPSGSYQVPQYNFFRDGIAEFTSPTKSCLRQSAGLFNFFEDFNFFTNSIVPLTVLDPNSGPYGVYNDSLIFQNCSWTGNGAAPSSNGQFGISARSIVGGVAQTLANADVPVILQGVNIFSGLQAAADWGISNNIYNEGWLRYYNGTQPFNTPATSAPIAFNRWREASGTPTFTNGWSNYGGAYQSINWYRENGRVYLAGAMKGGALGTSAFQLPVGYRPGGYHVFSAGSDTSSTAPARVDIDPTGTVVPYTGSALLISLSGISFEYSTYP